MYMNHPEVMTVEQVAAYLQLDRRTVTKLLSTGRLKGVKVGRVWRIHRKEVDRLLLGDDLREEQQ